jgi:DNA-binding MarR family transcriptional regulator
MDKYMLSNEGRARFKRMRVSGEAKFEGYEILDYLYDHGSSTAEELVEHTGLSRSKLMELILTFIHHGLVEGIH